MTKSAVEQRVSRLVGDGTTSGGGALPLSDAFRGVMEQILDEDFAPFSDLVKRITDEMHTKERRIIALWGSWEHFSADIIEHLSYRKLIRPEMDQGVTIEELRKNSDSSWVSTFRWHLADGIEVDKSYDAITAAEVRKATGNKEAQPFRIILHDSETRKQRDMTARAMTETNKWRGQLERLGMMDDAMARIADMASAHLQGVKVSSARPPQPADEPDVMVRCKEGWEMLPKTKDNFTVYWSRDQWYWRPTCKTHKAGMTGMSSRRDQVTAIVRAFMDDNDGKVPSAREVAARMGKRDDRTVRLDWDYLAARGDIPPRNEVTAFRVTR